MSTTKNPNYSPAGKPIITGDSSPSVLHPDKLFYFILDFEATCDESQTGEKIKMKPVAEIIEKSCHLTREGTFCPLSIVLFNPILMMSVTPS